MTGTGKVFILLSYALLSREILLGQTSSAPEGLQGCWRAPGAVGGGPATLVLGSVKSTFYMRRKDQLPLDSAVVLTKDSADSGRYLFHLMGHLKEAPFLTCSERLVCSMYGGSVYGVPQPLKFVRLGETCPYEPK
jgi:hypothetical protein